METTYPVTEYYLLTRGQRNVRKGTKVVTASIDQLARHEIFSVIDQDNHERIEEILNKEPSILINTQTLYQLNISGNLITFTPYSYALYLQRFNILNLFMKVIIRESQTTLNPLTDLLTIALQGGHSIREIEMLIELGADIKFGSYQAVILAISANRRDALEVFQKNCRDFDLSLTLQHQQTLLHIAIFYGSDKVVKYLLENNLDIEAKMMINESFRANKSLTPLEYCMSMISEPQLRENIERSISPSVWRSVNEPPNYSNCVKHLIEHGANPRSIDIHSNTLLHLLASSAITAESLNDLLKHGIDVNARNRLGETALHLIARIPNIELTRTLVMAGADPHILNCSDKLAIESAATREISEFLCQLLDAQTIYMKIRSIPYIEEYCNQLNQFAYGYRYRNDHTRPPEQLNTNLNIPPANNCLTFMEQNSSLEIEPLIQWQCKQFANDQSLPENVRAALESLSKNGFNAQKTLSREGKYATPDLKLLYNQKNVDGRLGRFINTHRRLFQFYIPDYVYKALLKESLFSATVQQIGVKMPNEVAQIICDYLKKDDIPNEATCLENMLPGMKRH